MNVFDELIALPSSPKRTELERLPNEHHVTYVVRLMLADGSLCRELLGDNYMQFYDMCNKADAEFRKLEAPHSIGVALARTARRV